MNPRRRSGYRDVKWIAALIWEPWTWIFIGSILLLLAALIQPTTDAVTLEGNFSSPPATVGMHLK
jgi:hypothetical protein